MSQSLVNLFKKKSKIELFTTPSHAQKFFIYNKLRHFYKFDISETDAYDPEDALLVSEKKAAKIYKTETTKFLTNGSSSGIIGAVLACVNSSDKVLIWENAHPSHKNAVKLAGAEPIFYEIEKETAWGVFGKTTPETLEKHLKAEKIKAVIVTSPSYEGIVSDIEKISALCKKYGCYLIVDEAHGALYPFSEKLPKSAIYQGADFVIQSLHKTAGGLNPTALLHSNIKGFEENIQKALATINTTSPSYPLLASIEKNIDFLNSKRGKKILEELIQNIENLKNNLKENNCEFTGDDITKILVKIPGLSGFELSEILFDKFKIEDERTNEVSTMLLTGVGCDLKKLKKLEHALKTLAK